jgi:signal transduction histidine kinase
MCGVTDHMGDLQRRLAAIESASTQQRARKLRVVLIAVGLVVVLAVAGLLIARNESSQRDRRVCELTQTMGGMTAAEARDYCR